MNRTTNGEIVEELASWCKEWRDEIRWQRELTDRYWNMFAELAREIPGIKKKMNELVAQVKELEDMDRRAVESEDGTEEEVDRGEGTSTGQREVWRKGTEEQEEIDMEVSDDEDAEGTEDDTEEGVVGKGKGKATEKRMEGDKNTLT
jgi:hypothetical protein